MKDPVSVLVVEDDAPHAEVVAETLRAGGFDCDVAPSGREGIERLQARPYDLVLTDLVMRDADGLDVLRKARQLHPDSEVIVMTGYPSYETCVAALEDGAFTYLNKPLNLDLLRAWVHKAVDRIALVRSNADLRRALDKRYGFEGVIGNSEAMQRVMEQLPQISQTDATVLITGESGTGKELVARAIHANSRRRNARLVPLNCAALSEGILESELFGHERGAFTGATQTRKGRFEFAHGGTLFLDEIGDMPASTQIKLLRVIESGEVTRVGSNEPIRVDVRLLAATNRRLEDLVREGTFREDLYYRLRVLTIHLPPLRDRMEDLPLLVESFIAEFAARHGKAVRGISKDALAKLFQYAWPGNVRELRNSVESMVVLCRGETVEAPDVPAHLQGRTGGASPTAVGAADLEGAQKHTARHVKDDVLREVFEEPPEKGGLMEAAERELIRRVLALHGGNREKAAKTLGIGERTLYRKIKECDLG